MFEEKCLWSSHKAKPDVIASLQTPWLDGHTWDFQQHSSQFLYQVSNIPLGINNTTMLASIMFFHEVFSTVKNSTVDAADCLVLSIKGHEVVGRVKLGKIQNNVIYFI